MLLEIRKTLKRKNMGMVNSSGIGGYKTATFNDLIKSLEAENGKLDDEDKIMAKYFFNVGFEAANLFHRESSKTPKVKRAAKVRKCNSSKN